MRISSLLVLTWLLVCNCFAYSDDLKIRIREYKTSKLGLNAAGELIHGEGHEFAVERVKEGNVLLAVKIQGKKYYVSYSVAENEEPKLIVVEKPDVTARWSMDTSSPSDNLKRDSPAWGRALFRAAGGPYAKQPLGYGDENKLVLLHPKLQGTFQALRVDVLFDNLNDGK